MEAIVALYMSEKFGTTEKPDELMDFSEEEFFSHDFFQYKDKDFVHLLVEFENMIQTGKFQWMNKADIIHYNLNENNGDKLLSEEIIPQLKLEKYKLQVGNMLMYYTVCFEPDEVEVKVYYKQYSIVYNDHRVYVN